MISIRKWHEYGYIFNFFQPIYKHPLK